MAAPNLEADRVEVPCPACSEPILKQATKCKHCGEQIGQPSAAKPRQVGFILGIGILFMPYLFSWATLRQGYSSTSRFISLTWMVILVAMLNSGTGSEKSSTVSSPVSVAPSSPAAPVDEMGMWAIGNYVDNFGDKTKSGYVTNKNKIRGIFSNSATTDSALLVDLILDDSKKMYIMLYEYAGKNPVKQYGSTAYTIMIKDKNGKKSQLSAVNYSSDRMSLAGSQAGKLHNALKLGGQVQVVIVENENQINNYSFVLENADGYSKAFEKLHSSKK